MEKCSDHSNLCTRMRNVDDKTDKIIKGLYGDLAKPQSGFIHEVTSSLKMLSTQVENLVNDKKEQKSFKGKINLAIFSALLALAASIFLICIQGTV